MPALVARLALASLLVASLGTSRLCAQSGDTGNTTRSALHGGTLTIAGQTFAGVKTTAAKYHNSLSEATDLTDNNGIDEIYVKDESGAVHVVYGYYSGLDNKVKRGFRGSINGQMVEVVHVNNEINTGTEGFTSSFDDIKELLKPILDEHFGKALLGAGVLTVGRLAPLALKHATLSAGLSAAASALLPTLLRGSGYGLAAMGVYVAGKTLWKLAQRLYLEYKKNNLHTIAMVTATNADELHTPVVVGPDQRREGRPMEIIDEVIRRTPAGGGTSGDGTTGGDPRSRAGAGTSGAGAPPQNRVPGPPILGADPTDPYSDLPRR